MSSIATSPLKPTPRIRWSWDFGPAYTGVDSERLLRLLKAIREFGTLGRAAHAAGISYRAAWGLLRLCESLFGKALVTMSRGRGTRLSELGDLLLEIDDAARSSLGDLHIPWESRLHEVLFPAMADVPQRLRVAASHDLALADWLENGRHIQVDMFWRGSEEALASLARGDCDVAGFHLPESWPPAQANSWLGRWLKPRQYVCAAVMRRRQGLLTAGGNPFGVASLADVARLGLRMVNRQRGSGTRSMIDQLLAANGLQSGGIPGYGHEEFTHDAVAATIASGQADVGFGIEAAAVRFDLGFIPLAWDRYCIAVHIGIAQGNAVRQLLRRFQGNTFHQRLLAMPGYEVSPAGELVPWDMLAASLAP